MKKNNKKFTSLLLYMMLIVAMACIVIGCGKPEGGNKSSTGTQNQGDVTVLGEGQTKFSFAVTDKDGNETAFEIHTDKEIVGEALMDVGLVEGEEGPYGLYVKKVNGISADYNTDGTYWAFYINGEYAMSGVDVTEIKEGDTYSFKVEK